MAWALPDDCVMAILGDPAEPGHGTVRLAGEWGPEIAADIREALVFDTLETWANDAVLGPGGRRVFLFAPADAGPWFDTRVPASFALQAQEQGSIGAQLYSFFDGEMEDGASRVVVIASDAPTLDPTIVVSAFLCLESRDIVLGPATDGGLYLVGARGSAPQFLAGIDWHSPHALSQSIDRLEDTGLSLSVLPPWYRVTQPEDVRMLAAHIRAIRRSGSNPGLPRLEGLSDGNRFHHVR